MEEMDPNCPWGIPNNRDLFGLWLLTKEPWMMYGVLQNFHTLTKEDREEIVGEARANALEAYDKGRFPIDFRQAEAFLRTTTRHCAIDWIRKHTNNPTYNVYMDNPEDMEEGMEDIEILRIELETCRDAALNELRGWERDAINLHLKGWLGQDIAKKIGYSGASVSGAISRWRDRVNDCLQK